MTVQIPERAFQSHLTELCAWLGFLVYHTHDSRKSQRGFPDLVIVGHGHTLFRELKTATGRVRPEQQQWIDALQAAGQDAAVWRPDQWDDIEHELKGLAGR